MASETLRLPARIEQENASNHASLAPLVEALSARLAAAEGEVAVMKAAFRAHMLECEAGLDAARGRLGQARNVEQRCKAILERMRTLIARVEDKVADR